MSIGINIAVVDDEKLFRAGLISMLKKEGFNVIGEAEDGEDLFPILKAKKPDVVVLDLEMPKLNGSKTLNRIRKEYPFQKVVIASKYHDKELIKDTFNRGANAFISKKRNGYEIVFEAIKRVKEYGTYTDNIADLFSNPSERDGHYFRLMLSPREIQVLHLLCNSLSYKKIGEELFISVNTVDNHLKSIFKKIKVKSREELVLLAQKNGLNYLGGY